MNKLNVILVITAISALALCLVGCGGGNQQIDNSSNKSDVELIIGEWAENDNATKVAFDGESILMTVSNGDVTKATYDIDESSHILTITKDSSTTLSYRFIDDNNLVLKTNKEEESFARTETEIEKFQFSKLDDEKTVEVSLGDSFSTDDLDIVFNDAYWQEADESGRIILSKKDDIAYTKTIGQEKTAYIIKTSITNKGSERFSELNACYGEGMINDNYKYRVSTQYCGSGFGMEPLDTCELVILMEIPNTAKEQFKNGEIRWAINPKRQYFASSFDNYETIYSFKF